VSHLQTINQHKLIWFSFGWVNASYIYGLQILTVQMRRALGALATWEDFERKVQESEAKSAGNL